MVNETVDGDDVAVALGHLPELDRCGFHAASLSPLSSLRQAALPPSWPMGAAATPAARRPSRRSPTAHWIAQITASISTISTELYAIATP
jgi:hypothetical protein